jgi:hypothetical protein
MDIMAWFIRQNDARVPTRDLGETDQTSKDIPAAKNYLQKKKKRQRNSRKESFGTTI